MGLDVGQGIALAFESFLDEAGDRRGVLTAEADGRGGLSGPDKLADVGHEVRVELSCLADGPETVAEDVDGYDGQDQEYDHQPSSGDGHRLRPPGPGGLRCWLGVVSAWY